MSATSKTISIPDTVTILESIRELAALVAYNYRNEWLDFPLTGNIDWEATQNSLLELIPAAESRPFVITDEITYPSMIHDRDAPGYILIFLADDNVIISEYDCTAYRVVDVDEALEYLADKIKNGHLGNSGGGEVEIINITELATEEELLDKLNRKYLFLIRRIINSNINTLRNTVVGHVGVDNSWTKKSDSSLIADLVVACTERYNGVLEELNHLLESLDQQSLDREN